MADSRQHEYTGVLHIHTRYSDGSGKISKIVAAAKKTGLDYIIVTDHNTLEAMENGEEGWYDDLLVLVGEEIGIAHGSHYLALGINETIIPEAHQEEPRRYVEEVKRQNGIGIVAHPDGLNNPSFDLGLTSWDSCNDNGYTGLEIWSYMLDWGKSITRLSLPYYYFYPEMAIDGPSQDLLQRWDRLCQTRRVVGIGGADAHALHMPPFNFLKFLSYERSFRCVRTHLFTTSPLSADLNESKKLIYSALGAGHCFFACDFLADSTGFNFIASANEGQKLMMGDEIKLSSEAEMEATSPVEASLRLIRNGQLIEEVSRTDKLIWKTHETGVYRVEARYNGRPWVFTNPIYLR